MEQLKSVFEQDINFDWSSDPRQLRDAYKKTNFDTLFFNLISKDVIKILTPPQDAELHNLTYDQDLVYKHLLGNLEKFICDLDVNASPSDVDKVFEQIRTLNQQSKLCRRILKSGDVTFFCFDCGIDKTCVLCIDCFLKSTHKDHNYRMVSSDGGGCCDCGDIEAWKQDHSCATHQAPNLASGMSLTDYEDIPSRLKQVEVDRRYILEKIHRLPGDMAVRYFLVSQACLHYIHTMLKWDDKHALPPYLATDQEDDPLLSKNYFTVLYNDEVHTFDYVINALIKVLRCSKLTATIIASTISREGRALVINDCLKTCKVVKSSIRSMRDTSTGPLNVKEIHGSIIAHQTFAIMLLDWIHKMASTSDAFRILTAFTLFGPSNLPREDALQSSGTLLEEIMLSNTTYWRVARIKWNDLFFAALLTEYSIKEKFARLITRNYPSLMGQFTRDDHEHSVSITVMTTQLYTVQSLVCMLIEEEDALSIVCKTFVDICKHSKRDHPSMMSYDNRSAYDMMVLKRGFCILSDLKHLIYLKPTKWTNKLIENVIKAVTIFLGLLDVMQGMDSVKRQLGQHLEYEPDWESGMTLQRQLVQPLNNLVDYCSLNEQVLIAALKVTQRRLIKKGNFKTITRELFGHKVTCLQYNVSTSCVSVHLPLTRFAAALILELMKRRPCDKTPYDESQILLVDFKQCEFNELEGSDRLKDASETQPRSSDVEQNDPMDFSSETREQGELKTIKERRKFSMIDIMEPSLRTEVMIAQFRSGMWRRNGFSLVNQILYFHACPWRSEMFDRDILVLQECAATCESNEFIIHLLNKFQLFSWVNSDTLCEPFMGHKAVSFLSDEDILAQTMSLGEELLQLLITIINERFCLGIGKVKKDDIMKNELIQLLCINRATRSDLSNKLHVDDSEIECIKSIATLQRSTEASTGKYELKDEYYDRFNPFFYHYSRRQQSNALNAQLKRKKTLKEELICCPPPAPVELHDQFNNLNNLLISDVLLTIIQKVLKRSLESPDSQQSSTKTPIKFGATDLQVDQCLYLIGLGLYEQERKLIEFPYVQAAHDKNIFEILKDCHEGGRSKDLVFWLLRKASNLVENLKTNQASSSNDESSNPISEIAGLIEPIIQSRDSNKKDAKKCSSELAAQRRERIMAMMKAHQDKFLSNPSTKQLVAETEKNERPQASKQSKSRAKASTAASTSQTTRRAGFGFRSKALKSITNSEQSEGSGVQTRSQQRISQSSNQTSDVEMSDTGIVTTCIEDEDEPMDIDRANETNLDDTDQSTQLCILCRDEQKIDFNNQTMVLLAHIQRSAVLSKNRFDRRIPNYALTPSNQIRNRLRFNSQRSEEAAGSPQLYSFTSDNSWSFDATFMPSDLFFGPYISTCGHVMHYECWVSFFDAVSKREHSRPNRNIRPISFELEKSEILCPLCECISNATIPLLPNYTRFEEPSRKVSRCVFPIGRECVDESPESLSNCLNALRSVVDTSHIRHIKDMSASDLCSFNFENKYLRLLQPKPINDVLEDLDEKCAFNLRDFIQTIRSNKISSNNCTRTLLNSISTLAQRIHKVGLDLDSSITDVNHARIFMMTSWSIAYTIQSNERTARFKGSPILEDLESSRNLCLSSLIRFACASLMIHQSDMVQNLLVRKLRFLLINEEHLSSSPCCLDVDAFEIFVSITILLQKLYAHLDDSSQVQCNKPSHNLDSPQESDGSENYAWTTKVYDHEYFRNILHLIIILNLVQVIITIQNERTPYGDRHLSDDLMNLSVDSINSSKAKSEVNSEAKSSKKTSVDVHSDSETLTSFQMEWISLQVFYKEVVLSSGHPNDKIPLIQDEFCTKIKHRLLPFLRSCSVFFYHLSRIPPPEQLRKKSAFFEGKDFVNPEKDIPADADLLDDVSSQNVDLKAAKEEYESICDYLALPKTLNTLLDCMEVRHLARSWLRHSRVLLLIESAIASKSSSRSSTIGTDTELMPLNFIRQPHSVNRLVDLPFDYSELADMVSNFTCPSIKNEDSRVPTMCLVCGVMLCSQSYCCQRDLNDLAPNHRQAAMPQTSQAQLVGSCTYHALECCGGVGVFLRVRYCQVLLLSGKSKGCYMPAPYIDDHGETDFGLNRGHPLHLNRQLYEKLQHMWLTHAIPEQISRTLEYSPHLSSIDWSLY